MNVAAKLGSLEPSPDDEDTANTTAMAYDQAGEDYLAYADGDPGQLYSFDGDYAFADRTVWAMLDRILTTRRASGESSIRILDAGCGPGTWLRRMINRAQILGFDQISARGFDVANAQVRRARLLSRELSTAPGVDLTFEVGDLSGPLPEADQSVDLCLCLYGVLNHLPRSALPAIFAEFARVTSGRFVGSVRSAGSRPSIFVDSLDRARDFKQDNTRDRCDVELQDGRRIAFNCHLFTTAELHELVARRFEVEDLRGLDMFHGRFAPDPRWNPSSLGANPHVAEELARLEEIYSADPDFMDRAAHLLLVARAKL